MEAAKRTDDPSTIPLPLTSSHNFTATIPPSFPVSVAGELKTMEVKETLSPLVLNAFRSNTGTLRAPGIRVESEITITVEMATSGWVGVAVGVFVGVFVGVLLGVGVGVFVGVLVSVLVGEFVAVLVGVLVAVGVGVFVGVFVGVLVGELVAVLVKVAVGLATVIVAPFTVEPKIMMGRFEVTPPPWTLVVTSILEV